MLYYSTMAIVEQEVIFPRWAAQISVTRNGDTLDVAGEGRIFHGAATARLEGADEDLLRMYRESVKLATEKRTGKRSPHIQFANCRTDDELIHFVEKFGPVLASPVFVQEELSTISASQPLDSLRRDHKIFAGAVRVVAALRSKTRRAHSELAEALAEIAEGVWLPGIRKEVRTSAGFQQLPWYGTPILLQLLPFIGREEEAADDVPIIEHIRQLRGDAVCRYAQIALCMLLNAFSPVLIPIRKGITEFPLYEDSGTLPALYFMLRQDYMRHQETKICARADCGAFFVVERSGQRFCTADCSRKQRQRDYWQERGSTLRHKRTAKQRRTKRGR
jgi:hypothetical protein